MTAATLLGNHAHLQFPLAGVSLKCKRRGREVWFLKRAQIFVGDVWGAFQVGLSICSSESVQIMHPVH